MKKRVISFLLLLVVAFIFGCSDSSSDNPSSASDTSEKTEKTEEKKQSTEPAVETIKGSGTIGTEGGKVKAGSAVTIKIPAEALKNDTKISVKYIQAQESTPSFSFLGEVEFGPSGTKFKKSAEVTMKLIRSPKNASVSVFNYDEKNDIWDYVSEAEVSDNTVKFKVDHFSKYRVVDISPTVLNKYIDIVKSAKENNTSDKKITQKYADYLKNDVKVMDSYVEQNDRLYKACGFRIDGAYYINGEEGDPNELSKQFGKSNKKGNRYGLSKIGSLLYSYADYVKKADGEKESQDCISISVIIDYEPVDAYKISGHIEENLEFDITSSLGIVETEIKSKGSIKLNIEYDFTGYLQLYNENIMTGTLSFVNAGATLSTKKLNIHGEGTIIDQQYIADESHSFFSTYDVKKKDIPDIYIMADVSKKKWRVVKRNLESLAGLNDGENFIKSFDGLDDIESFLDYDESGLGNWDDVLKRYSIISIKGKSHYTQKETIYSTKTTTESDYDDRIDIVLVGDLLLLDFELVEGTKTYTSSDFKDYKDLDDFLRRPCILERDHEKSSTKQTITIERMIAEE